MIVTRTSIADVVVIQPRVFGDDRGFFFESFNERAFADAIGRKVAFAQDNHSRSAANVLRGMHYQVGQPQGKLVRCVRGAVFDVAVDLRRSSATFGRWVGEELSESNQRIMWIPEGFAHGFLVLSESADFLYKTTDYWESKAERCVAWNDPSIGIAWPLKGTPLLSAKDRDGVAMDEAETFA